MFRLHAIYSSGKLHGNVDLTPSLLVRFSETVMEVTVLLYGGRKGDASLGMAGTPRSPGGQDIRIVIENRQKVLLEITRPEAGEHPRSSNQSGGILQLM